MGVIRREQRMLLTPITDEDVRIAAVQLANVVQERDAKEKEQAAVKAEMKQELANLDAQKKRLADVVSKRVDYRQVAVESHLDLASMQVREVRMDTGEIVSCRPATTADLQAPLLDAPREPARAAPACVCGHAEDEHSTSGECQIDGCKCAAFEPVEERKGDAGQGAGPASES